MNDIYVYQVNIPGNINEMVVPCSDGYTIYIDSDLSPDRKLDAYFHALRHINNHDFEREDVNEIELTAHGGA